MKLTFREVSFVSFCFTLIFSVEYCILLSVRREGPVRFKSENCPVTNCGSGWGDIHSTLLKYSEQQLSWQNHSRKDYEELFKEPPDSSGCHIPEQSELALQGHAVLLGSWKKWSCQAVGPAPQCALEAQSSLTTRVLERHTLLMFLWCPAGLSVMEHSPLPVVCIPAAGALWADSSVASSWSWHFLTTPALAPPHYCTYTFKSADSFYPGNLPFVWWYQESFDTLRSVFGAVWKVMQISNCKAYLLYNLGVGESKNCFVGRVCLAF